MKLRRRLAPLLIASMVCTQVPVVFANTETGNLSTIDFTSIESTTPALLSVDGRLSTIPVLGETEDIIDTLVVNTNPADIGATSYSVSFVDENYVYRIAYGTINGVANQTGIAKYDYTGKLVVSTVIDRVEGSYHGYELAPWGELIEYTKTTIRIFNDDLSIKEDIDLNAIVASSTRCDGFFFVGDRQLLRSSYNASVLIDLNTKSCRSLSSTKGYGNAGTIYGNTDYIMAGNSYQSGNAALKKLDTDKNIFNIDSYNVQSNLGISYSFGGGVCKYGFEDSNGDIVVIYNMLHTSSSYVGGISKYNTVTEEVKHTNISYGLVTSRDQATSLKFIDVFEDSEGNYIVSATLSGTIPGTSPYTGLGAGSYLFKFNSRLNFEGVYLGSIGGTSRVHNVNKVFTESGEKVLIKSLKSYGAADTTKPTITKHISNYDELFGEVSLTLKASDDYSELSTLKYRIGEDGNWQTSREFVVTNNGKYKFYAMDEAGNISEPYEIVVTDFPVVDLEVPVISNVSKEYNADTNKVKLTVEATDNIGVTEYSFDGGINWQESNVKEVSENGDVRVLSKDEKGNISLVYNIEVTEIIKTVTDIQIVNLQDLKKNYKLNEEYTPSGQIKVIFSDKSTELIDITKEMISKFDTSVVGSSSVELNYEGLTIAYDITVKEDVRTVTSIELENDGTIKTSYNVGESFEPKGSVLVKYSDGSYETVEINYSMVSKFNTTIEGASVVELTYGGKTLSYAINVVKEETLTPVDITVELNSNSNRVVKAKVKVDGEFKYIELPNGQKVYKNEFTYSIRDNGTYVFNVVGKDGVSTDSEIIEIDDFDSVAPIIAFSQTTTSSALKVTVIDDNYSHTLLPNGETTEEAVFDYDLNKGSGTFIAFDSKGNKSTKDYAIVNQVTIGASSRSTTFIHVAGNPTEWTNEDVELALVAMNEEDGVESVTLGNGRNAGLMPLNGVKNDIAVADTLVTGNGELEYTITTPYGTYTDTINVDKIDKDAPEVTLEVEGNKVKYTITDSLSGIARIYKPDGSIIELGGIDESLGSFTLNADGEFELIVEDVAGNISTKTFTVVYDSDYNEGSDNGSGDNGNSNGGNSGDNIPNNPDLGNGGVTGPDEEGNGSDNTGAGNGEGNNSGNVDDSNKPNSGGGNSDNGGNSSSEDDDDDYVNNGTSDNSNSTNGSGYNKSKESIEADFKAAKNSLQFTLPTGKTDLIKLLKLSSDVYGKEVVDIKEGVQIISFEFNGVKFEQTVEGINETGKNITFEDVSNKHWVFDALRRATLKGILFGKTDTTFSPKSNLTYAETYVALNRVLMLNDEFSMDNSRDYIEDKMSDMSKDHWAYYSAASILSKASTDYVTIIDNMGANVLSNTITRGEVARLLYELTKDINLPSTAISVGYHDLEVVPEVISYCTTTGLMIGDNKGNFNADHVLNRAELVSVVERLDSVLKYLNETN